MQKSILFCVFNEHVVLLLPNFKNGANYDSKSRYEQNDSYFVSLRKCNDNGIDGMPAHGRTA